MPRRQSSKSPSYSSSRRSYSSVPAPSSSKSKEYSKGKQPGVFGQMAATAGGVAVGSAVGHAVGRTVTGMFSGGGHGRQGEQVVQQEQGYQQAEQRYEEPTGPCAWEIKQFLNCASNNNDINLCQGFNEAIKACKEKHNIQ